MPKGQKWTTFTPPATAQCRRYRGRVLLRRLQPEKPMENALVECLNSGLRDELSNETLFLSPTDARLKIIAWKERYIRNRLHSSFGTLTPQELGKKSRLVATATSGQKSTDCLLLWLEGSRVSGHQRPSLINGTQTVPLERMPGGGDVLIAIFWPRSKKPFVPNRRETLRS